MHCSFTLVKHIDDNCNVSHYTFLGHKPQDSSFMFHRVELFPQSFLIIQYSLCLELCLWTCQKIVFPFNGDKEKVYFVVGHIEESEHHRFLQMIPLTRNTVLVCLLVQVGGVNKLPSDPEELYVPLAGILARNIVRNTAWDMMEPSHKHASSMSQTTNISLVLSGRFPSCLLQYFWQCV